MFVALISLSVQLKAQNEFTYGLVQDANDPLLLTALAIPNFTSNDVDLSTGTFTFLVPAGTTVSPAIMPLPSNGMFANITATWTVELLTPSDYASFSGNPASDLEGNDVYSAAFSSAVTNLSVMAGVPIELFSFSLPSNCTSMETVRILENGEAIQTNIFNAFFLDFNNSLSVGVDGAGTSELYVANSTDMATSASKTCPLGATVPVELIHVTGKAVDCTVYLD